MSKLVPQSYIDELRDKIIELTPVNSVDAVNEVLDRYLPRMTNAITGHLQIPGLVKELQRLIEPTGYVPIPPTDDIQALVHDGTIGGKCLIVGARSDEHVAQVSALLPVDEIEVLRVPYVLAETITGVIVHDALPSANRYDVIYAPMCVHHMSIVINRVLGLIDQLNPGGVMVLTDYDGNDVIEAQTTCLKVMHAFLDNVLYNNDPYKAVPLTITPTKTLKSRLMRSDRQVIMKINIDYRDSFDSSVTYYIKT